MMDKLNSILSFSKLKDEQTTMFVYSFIFWWFLYLLIHYFVKIDNKSPKNQIDTNNRLISIIHGLFSIYVSLIDYFQERSGICGNLNTYYQNNAMIISCSYFLYDFIACNLDRISNLAMNLHHLVCIFGFYGAILYNNSATEIMGALLLTEITNPSMHLREILKNYGLKKTKIYLVFDLIYMTKYILARLVFSIPQIIYALKCKEILLVVKLAAIFLWAQSLVFGYRMLGIFKYRYKEYLERKEKKIAIWWFENNKKLDEMEIYKNKYKVYVP